MKHLVALACAGLALAAAAADYPAPREGSWIVRDFRFHTGEVLPELRLHYTTVGAPGGVPVVLLHGTTGQARWWKSELAALLQKGAH